MAHPGSNASCYPTNDFSEHSQKVWNARVNISNMSGIALECHSVLITEDENRFNSEWNIYSMFILITNVSNNKKV